MVAVAFFFESINFLELKKNSKTVDCGNLEEFENNICPFLHWRLLQEAKTNARVRC